MIRLIIYSVLKVMHRPVQDSPPDTGSKHNSKNQAKPLQDAVIPNNAKCGKRNEKRKNGRRIHDRNDKCGKETGKPVSGSCPGSCLRPFLFSQNGYPINCDNHAPDDADRSFISLQEIRDHGNPKHPDTRIKRIRCG